jgi:hypothetical protein
MAYVRSSGIKRWSDPRATAMVLGIGGKKAKVVDAVLSANRSNGPEVIFPASITADHGAWRTRSAVELFVDFETVSDLADDFKAIPERGGQALIFQIGCGRRGPDGWTFRQFTVRELSLVGELEILDAWIAHLSDQAKAAGHGSLADVRLFHWSGAETSSFERAYSSARTRHPQQAWPKLGWYDLLSRVVLAEPVTVRGALGFGLKEVAKALHAHGLVNTKWEAGPVDGLGAMVGAWRLDPAALKDIGVYNETDCRMVSEILEIVRGTSTPPRSSAWKGVP